MEDLLKIAASQIGQKEIKGKTDNHTIVGYAKAVGLEWVTNDEIAWCSIFMSWACQTCGYPIPPLNKRASARSWLEIGEKVLIPETGDIVVFKRGDSTWQGHVGIFLSFEGLYVNVLGGNQGDQVKVSKYALADVLDYRKLKK